MKKIYHRACLHLLSIATGLSCAAEIEFMLLKGTEIIPYTHDITHLYLTSWQEYPDLCEASYDDYEPYVRAYGESHSGIACIAYDGSTLVAAATALPLLEKETLFIDPMLTSSFDLARIFYLGEVVVAQPYRNHGIGSHLFRMILKEIELGNAYYTHCLIYIVEPAVGEEVYAPSGYRPAQLFWGKSGFIPLYERRFTASWQSIMSHTLTFHTMTPLIMQLHS